MLFFISFETEWLDRRIPPCFCHEFPFPTMCPYKPKNSHPKCKQWSNTAYEWYAELESKEETYSKSGLSTWIIKYMTEFSCILKNCRYGDQLIVITVMATNVSSFWTLWWEWDEVMRRESSKPGSADIRNSSVISAMLSSVLCILKFSLYRTEK